MGQSSFDIVSQVDLQEVDNAVQQAIKEFSQRFDFKGKLAKIEFSRDEKKIFLTAENDFVLRSMVEVFQEKAARRRISLKTFVYEKVEMSVSGVAKQTVTIQQGIPKEKAKEIVNTVKDLKLKVQPQIQEDQVRVFGKDKDALQAVIQTLRGKDFGIPLQFANYR
ncbi:MAG: YajQ family cyclic di-GMP-binding protein [Candidatus Omnitrophota bacterium]